MRSTESIVVSASTAPSANGAVGLLLAAYLGITWYQGNLGKLAELAKRDFLGDDNHPALWRWLVALVLLYSLANSNTLGRFFTPVFWMAVVAMLIINAETQSDAWNNLTSGIRSFFGYSTPDSSGWITVEGGLKPTSPTS